MLQQKCSALLDVRNDFMSVLVRKRGFPRLPESQAGVSSVNRFGVSFSSFRVRKLARGHSSSLSDRGFTYLSPSETTTTLLKFPTLLSACVNLTLKREEKRSKVTSRWLLIFSSSHIPFLTFVGVSSSLFITFLPGICSTVSLPHPTFCPAQ